jgi:hypothetical protein
VTERAVGCDVDARRGVDVGRERIAEQSFMRDAAVPIELFDRAVGWRANRLHEGHVPQTERIDPGSVRRQIVVPDLLRVRRVVDDSAE